MKKQIFSSLGVVTFLLVGCGGGGSGEVVNVAEIIEKQYFYRVKAVDQEKYLEELFDGNGTLYEDTYLILGNVLDDNRTLPYEIISSRVYITDNNVTSHCSVVDSNLSVTFYCLKEGSSGSGVPTTRWKSLDDAIANPE